MIDVSFIVLIVVDIVTRMINIPYKCLAFCDKVIETMKSLMRHIFDEIKRTGEFTVTFRVIRSVHDEKQEKNDNFEFQQQHLGKEAEHND
jgi:hypothetical protein